MGGVLGAGELALGTASAILTVLVLSIYFLVGLPRIKLSAYQVVPHSRRPRVILIGDYQLVPHSGRPRVILIGDEIQAKVGGYMLGNFITLVIAAVGTFLWLLALADAHVHQTARGADIGRRHDCFAGGLESRARASLSPAGPSSGGGHG